MPEQMVSLNIQGKLLTWNLTDLPNQTVLFGGINSAYSKVFGLGTPQGGVLFLVLLNILTTR